MRSNDWIHRLEWGKWCPRRIMFGSSEDRAKNQATRHFGNSNLIPVNTQRSFPKSNPICTKRKSAQRCKKHVLPVFCSIDLCHGKNWDIPKRAEGCAHHKLNIFRGSPSLTRLPKESRRMCSSQDEHFPRIVLDYKVRAFSNKEVGGVSRQWMPFTPTRRKVLWKKHRAFTRRTN